MVLAIHLVWTCYGWWFPNDLRGSWSNDVWSPAMLELGNIDKRGRKSVQPSSAELRKWLLSAQNRLKYEPVILDAEARKIVRDEITAHSRIHNYAISALAVMPEHVHIVVGRHDHGHGRIVRGLKAVSSRELRKILAASFTRRDDRVVNNAAKRVPIWSRGYWVRFLDTEAAISAAVTYVNGQKVSPRKCGG
jgi:REP element-mobilizing transposase RayT